MKSGGKGGISYLGGANTVLTINTATISKIESTNDGGSFYSSASTLATVNLDTVTINDTYTDDS